MTDPLNPHVNHGLQALDLAQMNRRELDMLWTSIEELAELLARAGVQDAASFVGVVKVRRADATRLRAKR